MSHWSSVDKQCEWGNGLILQIAYRFKSLVNGELISWQVCHWRCRNPYSVQMPRGAPCCHHLRCCVWFYISPPLSQQWAGGGSTCNCTCVSLCHSMLVSWSHLFSVMFGCSLQLPLHKSSDSETGIRCVNHNAALKTLKEQFHTPGDTLTRFLAAVRWEPWYQLFRSLLKRFQFALMRLNVNSCCPLKMCM